MKELTATHIPKHIGIIMDGNGRWARIRGWEIYRGHKEGAERVRDIARFCSRSGVRYLTLFAFSNENWNRPKEEIDSLMGLLTEFLTKELGELNRNNIRLLISGRKNFSPRVLKAIGRTVEKTSENTGLVLVLCLDYGGRQEILDASSRLHGLVSEDEFRKQLYVPDVPDIDLLIRTSGEERVSNFMLWQISYSELYFTQVMWPDFDEKQMEKALKSYSRRKRRFGKRI
ncbi:MAG: di-trans,poly-cis-decaprenylcistransferase [Elusimicrobia bacterium]|nr:di-trans,poly-cis-decaprenylcistransferase [Elusimicrobiota bacterium]